jgi:hypothetical protein
MKPAQRMNEFTVKRVGKKTISIPRKLNSLANWQEPSG